MAPYKVLYGKKCQPPLYWNEVGERSTLSPDIVQEVRGESENCMSKAIDYAKSTKELFQQATQRFKV